MHLLIGLYLYGAMYVIGLFVAGLFFHSAATVVLALVTAGISYLSYFAQLAGWPEKIANSIVYASIVLGILGGIVLVREVF